MIVAALNGCGGGILRDVLSAQLPRVLHADFYATIALGGGLLMHVLVRRFALSKGSAGLVAGAAIFLTRIAAIVGEWRLPHLR